VGFIVIVDLILIRLIFNEVRQTKRHQRQIHHRSKGAKIMSNIRYVVAYPNDYDDKLCQN
jgi:uncharacterized membrane protein YecN with MAPEG domain